MQDEPAAAERPPKARPLRIVYLHGLETDLRRPDLPGNTKLSLLRGEHGERLVAPDLATGRHNWDRRNSVLRCFFRLPALRLAALLASALFAALLPATSAFAAAALSLSAFLAASQFFLVPAAVEASVSASLKIAEEAIVAERPELLIGSSWGGALACLAVQRGSYAGPVLLLAPGGAQIARRCPSNSKLRKLLEAPLPSHARGVCVHGTRDGTVPVGDSEQLCRASPRVVLQRKSQDTHALRSLLRAGVLSRLVAEAAGRL